MLQLLLDADLPASEEVDVGDRQAEGLPLAETGAGADDGEGSVALGQGVQESLDLLSSKGLDLDVGLMSRLAAASLAAARLRRAFMFTDIAGSSQLVEFLGDEASDLLRCHDHTLKELFAEHGGDVINRLGDGFFVAFEGPEPAVSCAVAVQQALSTHRRDHGFAPEVRIGIHAAEATHEGGHYQGEGVHQAARIGGAASASEILVSCSTLDGVERVRCSPPRTIVLKGFSEPVPAVAVEWRR